MRLPTPVLAARIVLCVGAFGPLACAGSRGTDSKATPVMRERKRDIAPLMLAAHRGELALVEALLRQGAAIDQRDADGYTALHHATRCGDVRIVRLLLEAGADVNARSKEGVTPLIASIDMAVGRPEISATLIEAGADVNAVDSQGHTALWIATTESSLDVMRDLLGKGANPNAALKASGETPLHLAASNGLADRVALLLRFGAAVTSRDREGKTPLDVANKRSPETKRLLEEAAKRPAG